MSALKAIVLVTGGNNGIGLAACQLFATQPNYHCIMGSRSQEKGQKAISSIQSSTPGAAISLVQLDVTSDVSIAAAVAEVKAKHGHLDILINDAGVCPTDFSRSTLPLGSISQRCDPANQAYSSDYKVYRMSKAALNMLVACDAWQYEGKMKRAEKEKAGFAKSFEGSARGLLNIADGKRDGENGMFLHDEKAGSLYDW
ncbi:NAD(P)-binding protein [Hyaloscypha variabilis]